MSDKITKDMTINDTLRLYPETTGVFTTFGMDSCCGGAASIEASCERDGAPLEEVLKALNDTASEK